MKRTKSWFKAEAKWTAAILYGLPAAGLLAALVLFFVRILRAG
ncbi:MAG TPA: hypothetical protein VK421_18445 [Pyrinomonadaceae bacterium]|nr:hypothetical protein [Pyrinomonadaceae bacterium]